MSSTSIAPNVSLDMMPLPCCVVPEPANKIGARVGVNTFLVDLLELEVLQGRGVAWKITHTPLPVLLIHWMVNPAPSLRPAGLCLGRSGVVTDRSFFNPFTSCARPCSPPLMRLLCPLPFSVPVWSLCYPCFVCCLSCWVWGAALEHWSRHRQDT